MPGFKSWCVTVRPRQGLKDDRLDLFLKWAEKQEGAYGVCEGEGESKHLHLQIFCEERFKGDINRAVERIFKRLSYEDDELKVLRRGTRIAYNNDWMDCYLQKEEEVDVVINNVPENTSDYYPTEEEQDKVKNKSNAVDQYFHSLKEDLEAWKEKEYSGVVWVDVWLVKEFIADKMYKEKTYKVIQDPKKISALCISLQRYYNGESLSLLSQEELEQRKLLRKHLDI
ncbi:hypothetical protein [Shewanella sp.]|uniref:hypothetical protein n=1 Tax=Shewanella sp. TaxID=50422 RepID=UPI004048516C